MSTGGGWQDQVGGATPGLKYISSMPGLKQEIKVTHVEIPESARKERNSHFIPEKATEWQILTHNSRI